MLVKVELPFDDEGKVYNLYLRRQRLHIQNLNDLTLRLSLLRLLIENLRVIDVFRYIDPSITDVNFLTVMCVNVIWDALRYRRRNVSMELSFHCKFYQL